MTLNAYVRAFDPQRDWERFVALNFITFFESMPPREKVSQEDFRKHYDALLAHYAPGRSSKGTVTVAASDADDYLGHLWLGVQNDFFTNIPTPWVFDLSVRPEYRGHGIGKLLLDDCIHRCRSVGMRTIGLQVMAHNVNAKKFYEREGFAPKAHSLIRPL